MPFFLSLCKTNCTVKNKKVNYEAAWLRRLLWAEGAAMRAALEPPRVFGFVFGQ